ncbi:MAG: tagatose-bisphosphate aldolase [Acidobacteria bacterium]|nr:MAG: tagatose-bisphosphate aldolase [Acidobacteriota bacterium]
MVAANLKGIPVGICSICSANPYVLRAGMNNAKEDRSFVLIESTSNQVNQFGGYTGMNAAGFRDFVKQLAFDEDFPADRIILGGDHLGPYPWRSEPSECAMQKAADLVRSYVEAGFTKIHLDASMRCADDGGDPRTPLDERVVIERAVALAQVAEEASDLLPPGSARPVYVIGTEVPVPGGEKSEAQAPEVTAPKAVESTLDAMQSGLQRCGLADVRDRIIAIVVQPGVEYSDNAVFEYDRSKTSGLTAFIARSGSCAYEAHSTDYQKPDALRQMVEDHYPILKVGPWLTFAFREAVFALSFIEEEWLGGRGSVSLSHIRETLESAMLEDPRDWKNYYSGDEAYLGYARKYSYSDRSRYYWPRPKVQEALSRLLKNLADYPPPLTLLSQFLPAQYEAVRDGKLRPDSDALIQDKVREVLRVYSRACGGAKL